MGLVILDTYELVLNHGDEKAHIEKNDFKFYFNPEKVPLFLTGKVENEKDYMWLIIENKYRYIVKKSDFVSILQ